LEKKLSLLKRSLDLLKRGIKHQSTKQVERFETIYNISTLIKDMQAEGYRDSEVFN
jgi:hypothetical protein